MQKQILRYRIVLFLGLGVSALVVLLFKNLERELAAQTASALFLIFGLVSIEIGRQLKDKILISSAILFLLLSVFPILITKYILTDSLEMLHVFHRIGNITFFGVNGVALVRLFRLRLKSASVQRINNKD